MTVYGDNDESYTGQKAAYTLAFKLKSKGYIVNVVLPEKQGEDFNDLLIKALALPES